MPTFSQQALEVKQLPKMTELPRPVYIRLECYSGNVTVGHHAHAWGQLTYSLTGIMRVDTTEGSFVIPPQYALWIPEGVEHRATMVTETEFRSLYVGQPFLSDFPDECVVYEVSDLVRELIKGFSEIPVKYDESGVDGRLTQVMMDQILKLPVTPLYLPLPTDDRLQSIADCLLNDPADNRTLSDWAEALQTSTRTLSRLFDADIGMGFREWKQRILYLAALQHLEQGRSITATALELGYDSVSAFITMFKKTCGQSPGEYLKNRGE